ncbi:hypothetical protein [Streptomyces sp. MI02-7b]|uniref:hypothetical protein n=1 Tax=Streptomyces sp. MI02-7b TaxID=462941 RepID=UPI0029B00A7B|nr:hypothetical protein [Streptomyces sp. MI02-7b]MDX3072347.1 hypothetical protein [Streptomyces sp. MI02-7b]
MTAVRQVRQVGQRSGGTATEGIRERASAFSLRRWAPRPAARLDPAGGNPDRARLLASTASGDWPAMRAQLSAVTDDWERSWLIAAATDVAGFEQWMPGVVEAEGDSGLALLVAGARGVSWAWEARTGARASHVSREQFRIFHERLETAEDLLYRAAELEPGWASPWYFLQMCGRGLQIGPDLARLRFEASVRRVPGHLGAHQQHLQQVCAKWSGSHEEMHAFARESMESGPEGGPLGVLVAVAHLEHWLHLDQGADSAYILQDHVSRELHEAADRSIRHPGFAGRIEAVECYNVFAMAFALAGEKRAAAAAFAATRGLVTRSPWQYINGDDPRVPYRALRSGAGRH